MRDSNRRYRFYDFTEENKSVKDLLSLSKMSFYFYLPIFTLGVENTRE